MKIIQHDDVPLVRGLEHRGGTFHSRTLAEGTPGTPGNFKFSLSRLGTDYSGPRHRHNFDQYRFMIEGWSDYGQDGPLKEGMLGYYPEACTMVRKGQQDRDFLRDAVVRRRQRLGPSAPARGQGRHGGAEKIRRVQRRHLPPQRRRPRHVRHFRHFRQAQHGCLPGDLGARARARDGLSQRPLRRADLCRCEELRLGAGARRAGRVRKAVRGVDRAAHRSRPDQTGGGREP